MTCVRRAPRGQPAGAGAGDAPRSDGKGGRAAGRARRAGSCGVWGNRVPGFTPLRGVRVGRAVPATRENLR